MALILKLRICVRFAAIIYVERVAVLVLFLNRHNVQDIALCIYSSVKMSLKPSLSII